MVKLLNNQTAATVNATIGGVSVPCFFTKTGNVVTMTMKSFDDAIASGAGVLAITVSIPTGYAPRANQWSLVNVYENGVGVIALLEISSSSKNLWKGYEGDVFGASANVDLPTDFTMVWSTGSWS